MNHLVSKTGILKSGIANKGKRIGGFITADQTNETLHLVQDEVRAVLQQLDELAEVWGDEGVFRRCRDRLRKLVELNHDN